MRRINLLPRELAVRRRSRQMLAAVAAGALALVALLGIVYVAQRARLAGARGDLERQQVRNQRLQRQVSALQQFAKQEEELSQKRALLQSVTRNEVLWSGILTEISLVLPPDAWLTNFTGNLTTGVATGGQGAGQQQNRGTQPTGAIIGQLQMDGCTLLAPDGEYLNVAQYLIQIAKPLTFSDDPFLSIAARGDDTCPIRFNSQVQVTDAARRSAQPGRERG